MHIQYVLLHIESRDEPGHLRKMVSLRDTLPRHYSNVPFSKVNTVIRLHVQYQVVVDVIQRDGSGGIAKTVCFTQSASVGIEALCVFCGGLQSLLYAVCYLSHGGLQNFWR